MSPTSLCRMETKRAFQAVVSGKQKLYQEPLRPRAWLIEPQL